MVCMTDGQSVLKGLVLGNRWSFWHNPNNHLGRMDADIEICAIPRNNVF